MHSYKLINVNKGQEEKILAKCDFFDDINISGQFKFCAKGGEDGLTKCIALVNKKSKKMVGFVGYTLTKEDLEREIIAYITIEFIFIQKNLRKNGLSQKFIEHVTDVTGKWFQRLCSNHSDRKIQLHSASSPKSDDGEAFVSRLEAKLRYIAKNQGASFLSPNDDD